MKSPTNIIQNAHATFRLATRRDIHQLVDLQIDSILSGEMQPVIKKLFTLEFTKRWEIHFVSNAIISLLVSDEVISGFIILSKQNSTTVEIKNILIQPNLRRKKHGTCLFQNALLELNKIKNVTVWLLNEDKHAQTFFKALGFVRTQQSRNADLFLETRYHCLNFK